MFEAKIQEAKMVGIKFSRSRGTIGVGLAALLGVLAVILLFFAVVLIESGNVGVKKTLGKVQPEEVTPGLTLRIPGITSIAEFVGKEIAIDLTDLTPKAADNLSLRDMDVSIFYRAESDQISDLYVKYANAHQYDQESDSFFPAYRLVFARRVGPPMRPSPGSIH